MIEIGDKLYIVETECVSPKDTWLMCYQDGPQDSPPLAIFVSLDEAVAHAEGLSKEFVGSKYRVVEGYFTQQFVHEED